jgi:GT2 family glycosyltransferase
MTKGMPKDSMANDEGKSALRHSLFGIRHWWVIGGSFVGHSSFASVLIVNYNGRRHLDACLTALERQTAPRHRFEVVVVDNASSDDSREVIPAKFPWVRFVALDANVGFAEGNNIALRSAHGRVAVLLNNDTIPDPFWLEELLRTLDEQPGQLAVSKLVFAADPRAVNSGGLVLLRDGRGADDGFRAADDGRFESTRPVFAGCGAAVAVPVEPGGEIFDGRYFMYYEDTDLGWRCRLAGRGAVFAPRSVVRHVHGAAAGDATPLFRFHVERNRAVTALRNADLPLAVWSGLVLAAKVGQAVVRVALRRQRPAHAAAVARAFGSYLLRLPQTLAERYTVRG